MNNLNNYLTNLKIVVLAVILTAGISFVFAQWQDPPGPFSAGQMPPPVHVGSDSQTKQGPLWADFVGSLSGLYADGNAEVAGRITIGGGNPQTGRFLRAENNEGLAFWSGPPNLSCTRRQAQTQVGQGGGGAVPVPAAACQLGEVRVGGGGDCDGGKVVKSAPSVANDTDWVLECDVSELDTATLVTHVICCSIQ